MNNGGKNNHRKNRTYAFSDSVQLMVAKTCFIERKRIELLFVNALVFLWQNRSWTYATPWLTSVFIWPYNKYWYFSLMHLTIKLVMFKLFKAQGKKSSCLFKRINQIICHAIVRSTHWLKDSEKRNGMCRMYIMTCNLCKTGIDARLQLRHYWPREIMVGNSEI